MFSGKKVCLFLCVLAMVVSTALASGTGAGTSILAVSTDVKLSYSDGSGGTASKNASIDNIGDWAQTVKAIHGLLPGGILNPGGSISGFSGTNHGAYTDLPANADYVISFTYANRSNEFVTADVASTLTQAASRWSIADSAAKVINEDQNQTFYVTVNSGTALSLEYVTLNVTASITDVASGLGQKNVVSYNVFAGVVSSDMQLGAYGGGDNFFNYYILRAQGFDLSVVTRNYLITAPTTRGYTGGVHDPVPGAKISYTIVVKNNNSAVATNVDISDKIPNNCHLYFNDTPTVEGEVSDAWVAEPNGFTPTVNTTAAGTVITFNDVSISGNYTVTLNYTVTID